MVFGENGGGKMVVKKCEKCRFWLMIDEGLEWEMKGFWKIRLWLVVV